MYDINGTSQIASYDISVGRSEATHYYGLKAGTYFVRAFCYGGYGSYRVSSQFTAAQFANDAEPNDSLSAAKAMQLNTKSTGHLGFFGNGIRDQYDFYTFTLPTAWDTLFIRTDSDTTIDIDLALFDQSGNQISSSITAGTTELFIHPQTSAGTYSIRLFNYSGYGSYTIILSNTRPKAPSTGMKDEKSAFNIPQYFSLSQNFPNPFNPETSFEFQIPTSGFVSIRVFDLLGHEVANLLNDVRPAGVYRMTWNASTLPSGVYFYRLQAGNNSQVKKALLLK
jgi:hypothetical protein